MKKLEKLKELFWDYKWDSVLRNLNSPYVIARVLEIGNEKQVRILIEEIGQNNLKNFLEKYGKRLLSKVSYNFWKLYYEKNFIKRTQKSCKSFEKTN